MMLATFRNWALDESPTSRRQAAWGDRYRIWLGLKGNALGMIGLSIILLFILLALLANKSNVADIVKKLGIG